MKFKLTLINFLSKLLNIFTINTYCNFRILMFHNIEIKNFQLLESNLKALKKTYNFIDPNKFDMDNNYPKGKKNLLITFDDGFKSNFFFANTVLKNIFPQESFSDKIKFDVMTWSDLRNLEKMGHVIGAHTKSHLRLTDIKSLSILKNQILSPINTFKKNQIKKPIFFAYSFGDFYSFNKKCFNIAKDKYEFIFSGIRGDNKNFNKVLFRDNIEDNYTFEMINFFIRGYSDFLYKNFRKIILSF